MLVLGVARIAGDQFHGELALGALVLHLGPHAVLVLHRRQRLVTMLLGK